MTSILVVEDDDSIRSGLVRGLGQRGMAVRAVGSGLTALELVVKEQPDVVLLDLGLPDLDGRQVLTMIRAVSQVPVIVVTAQDDDRSVVAALDGGADDYVVKPFGIEQVAARIRAVLRRGGSDGARTTYTVGEPGGRPGDAHGDAGRRPLELARKEFDLLLALASRKGEVVTRRELARRGLAAAVRRRRADRRRPRLVAAPQAGRDGGGAALPAHRPGRRDAPGGP